MYVCTCRADIGLCEGEEGVGGGVERWRGEGERAKKEMFDELTRLQQRKLELLSQLSSLGPSPVVMELLHRLEECTRDLDTQISGCTLSSAGVLCEHGSWSHRWLCTARSPEAGAVWGAAGGCL